MTLRSVSKGVTGKWDGTFSYDHDYGPVTPFLAELEENSGAIGGKIIEPDAYHGSLVTLQAIVSGQRDGSMVSFIKTYGNAPEGYEFPVRYEGILSEDGLSITGRWRLLLGSGNFEMHRDFTLEEEAEAEELLEALLPG